MDFIDRVVRWYIGIFRWFAFLGFFGSLVLTIAGIFNLFGESYILMKMINVMLSTLSVVIFWNICLKLSSYIRGSQIATFIFSFHPATLIYSTSTLREPFILILFLGTLYFFILFIKNTKLIISVGNRLTAEAVRQSVKKPPGAPECPKGCISY